MKVGDKVRILTASSGFHGKVGTILRADDYQDLKGWRVDLGDPRLPGGFLFAPAELEVDPLSEFQERVSAQLEALAKRKDAQHETDVAEAYGHAASIVRGEWP